MYPKSQNPFPTNADIEERYRRRANIAPQLPHDLCGRRDSSAESAVWSGSSLHEGSRETSLQSLPRATEPNESPATRFNRIVREVRALSPEYQLQLRNKIDEWRPSTPPAQAQEPEISREVNQTISPSSTSNFRVREMRWLSEHRSEYAGQWIVIEGDQLIAHGTNSREVSEAARRAGITVPFLVHIEPEDQLPFGGW